MANYSQLKAAIADVIKTNGTQAITGQVLQDVLNSIVSVIGANYTFAGVATPATNPGTPDQNVVYMASEAGTYTNFGAVEIPKSLTLFFWDGQWNHQTLFNIEESMDLAQVMAQVIYDNSVIMTPVPANRVTSSFFNNDGTIGTNSNFEIQQYSVSAGEIYAITANHPSGVNVPFIAWADEDNNWIYTDEDFGINGQYIQKVITVPAGVSFLWFNSRPSSSVLDGMYKVEKLYIDNDLRTEIAKIESFSSKKTELPLSVYQEGAKFVPTAEIKIQSAYKIYEVAVTGGNAYLLSARRSSSGRIVFLAWLDSNRNFIKVEDYGRNEERLIDKPVVAPSNASYAWINSQKSLSEGNYKLKSLEAIQSEELDTRITAIETKMSDSHMKVVILNDEPSLDSQVFYIRTRYNSDKDIILTHWCNKNGLLSYEAAYIGSNSMTDEELMTSTYLVSEHTDSTAPLLNVTQYWHLFGQHGYLIPYITNAVGMSISDVGALWKDQLDRQYHIGKVTEDYIYLLPVIYQDGGHYVRDWKNKSNSPSITELIHVNGGVFTTTFNVDTNYQIQLQPIMTHSSRKFVVDGNEVGEGTYMCDSFCVSESQVGYDPATVQDWFGGANGNPDLTGALPMAKFTVSYNYFGAQCCVNSTIEILREVECVGYGGIQQQFFYDKGDYKAMFLIPKAKAYGGVEIDKPFNSPNSSGASKAIYRTSDYLKDVNNPVDRLIGYLYNPNDGTYLVGMAAGLSIVSGDTVKSKRIQYCLEGSTNIHYRLLNFSPSNTNKFYIMAFNSSPYSNNDYYLPNTLFHEVNYYVSYFDPAENTGQVYWYKDGKRYIIYCHCQTIQNRLAINVPKEMEGLSLSVVEKTENAELLTDTIANGKFFVNYNTDDANYIVLIAE